MIAGLGGDRTAKIVDRVLSGLGLSATDCVSVIGCFFGACPTSDHYDPCGLSTCFVAFFFRIYRDLFRQLQLVGTKELKLVSIAKKIVLD